MKISIDEILNYECNTPQKKCGCYSENYSNSDNMSKKELLKKISEVGFAIYDLNLFLDTHPHCEEALKLFKSLAFTLESLKTSYQAKYGPLEAMYSSDKTPFEWVSENQKWPWQKEGE